MPSLSTYYNLYLFDATSDTGQTFLTYRNDTSGTGVGSNMNKIDTALNTNATNISGLAGAGRTTETVKTNADNITTLQGQVAYSVSATPTSANTYTATVTGISAYSTNLLLLITFAQDNSGAATININGLGPKSLTKIDSTGSANTLVSADIKTNKIYQFRYNGTSFVAVDIGVEDHINILTGGYIGDENGNKQISFTTTSSAVNQVGIRNAATKSAPQVQAIGGDTNIDLNFVPKGTGNVLINNSNIAGFNMDLPYYYGANVKPIALFQADETWTSGAGTQSNDLTNIKIGTQSLKVLENDNVSGNLYSGQSITATDFTKFPDGSAISSTDYLRFVFYVSDATKILNGVYFLVGNTSVDTNSYTFSKTTGINTGWNYVDFPISTGISYGSPNWAAIDKLRVTWSSATSAQNAYVSFQYAAIIRKDSTLSIPNQFQRNINGTITKEFTIPNGYWFLGNEFGVLTCKPLDTENANAELDTVATYNDFISSTTFLMNNSTYTDDFYWYADGNNYLRIRFYNGIFYLSGKGNGSAFSVTGNTVVTAVGNIMRYETSKSNNTIYISIYLNNVLVQTFTISGYTFVGNGYFQTISYSTVIKKNILNFSVSKIQNTFHAIQADWAKNVGDGVRSWIPTLTWTTGTPDSISTIARYTTIGNLCFFHVFIYSTDGNGATNLTVSLPVSAKVNSAYPIVTCCQSVNGAAPVLHSADILDNGTNTIEIYSFTTCTDNQACYFKICGFYEI